MAASQATSPQIRLSGKRFPMPRSRWTTQEVEWDPSLSLNSAPDPGNKVLISGKTCVRRGGDGCSSGHPVASRLAELDPSSILFMNYSSLFVMS